MNEFIILWGVEAQKSEQTQEFWMKFMESYVKFIELQKINLQKCPFSSQSVAIQIRKFSTYMSEPIVLLVNLYSQMIEFEKNSLVNKTQLTLSVKTTLN